MMKHRGKSGAAERYAELSMVALAAAARRWTALGCLLGLLLGAATQAQAQPTVAVAAVEQREVVEVNINKADAEELAQRLNGVGMRRAEAIVRYREQFGAFESVEELAEVSGIGAATVERNRDVIRLR